MSDVVPCELQDIFELAAKARDDGVSPKPRPGSQWYRVGDAGILCLWTPQNRSGVKRISHEWVDPDCRGEGVADALLKQAIDDAKKSDAEVVDIYVRDPGSIQRYGFEEGDGGNAGYNYTYMVKRIG